MLKVLHSYRTYFPDPPGGLQEAIRQIALATGKQNIANTIFTLSPQCKPSVLERPEAEVVRCRSWASPASCDIGSFEAFKVFSRLANSSDVLHTYFPWPFVDLLQLVARPKIPSVLTYISDVVRQRWLGAAYAPLMWRTLRQASAVVAIAPAYARTSPVLSHPSIRDKVRVIPLGIDENSYPSKGDDRILRRIGLEYGEPFFLFLGVLRYYKGIHFLLEAAKNVGVRIVVAGTGPEELRLHGMVDNLGLKNVIFAGQVDVQEKVSLLQNCRALVLPSHLSSEAFGMVLVEAAMFGKPLISCDIGTGTSFVNSHEETGFVVQPQSPEALSTAMNLLHTDDRLADEMGHGARKRYEQLFSGPALGKAYADLFREVAGT